MSLNSSNPRTPAEYVRAIGKALDEDDRLIVNFYVKKFSILYPTEFEVFKAAIMNGNPQ